MVIIAALRIEIAPLVSALSASKIKSYGHKAMLFRGRGHDILVTGVGRPNAERALNVYLREQGRPDLILNIGSAGILNNKLNIGETYAISDILMEGKPPLSLVPLTSLTHVRCLSVSQPVNDDRTNKHCRDLYQADLVDMECYAIAEIAQSMAIPVSAIKAATDPADPTTRGAFLKNIDHSARKLADNTLKIFNLILQETT